MVRPCTFLSTLPLHLGALLPSYRSFCHVVYLVFDLHYGHLDCWSFKGKLLYSVRLHVLTGNVYPLTKTGTVSFKFISVSCSFLGPLACFCRLGSWDGNLQELLHRLFNIPLSFTGFLALEWWLLYCSWFILAPFSFGEMSTPFQCVVPLRLVSTSKRLLVDTFDFTWSTVEFLFFT